MIRWRSRGWTICLRIKCIIGQLGLKGKQIHGNSKGAFMRKYPIASPSQFLLSLGIERAIHALAATAMTEEAGRMP